jgi:perosamine synthetase
MKVVNNMIPQYEPLFNREELKNELSNYVISEGWFTEYKNTEEFENKIKEFLGVKYCSLVNNGTISLSLALLAGDIKPGDEVLVPNLTMIATANAVRLIGAIPVFVDVSPENLCMNLLEANKKISPKTKALIYVTLNGRSEHPLDIQKFCANNSLFYISDDAQSLGSSYCCGLNVGTFGDIASFSFSMPKIISTGQGGALVTNDDYFGNKIKKLKDFGRISGGLDIHEEFGINSKFTELQAILGLNQFKTITERIKRKKEIYSLYFDYLKDIKKIHFITTELYYVTPWFVDIYVEQKKELQEYLNSKEIKTRSIYPPLNTQKCYLEHYDLSFPISNEFSNKGIWLPSSLTLTNENIEYICNKIKEFYNE